MEFSNAELFGDDRGVHSTPALPQRRPQPGVPANLQALINGMAAQIRQLSARVAQLEGAVPKLAANDKKTADYVNGLAGMIQGVDKQTQQAINVLRTFARGGGVQPAQFVPRAADAVVAYPTPRAATPGAQSFQPATGPGPSAELVDPGSDDASPVTDYDKLFFSGEED